MMRRAVPFLTLALTVLVAAACVVPVAPATPAAPVEDTRLRIALIPVLDVLPFYVAEQKGYFAAQGIQVEGVPVKSGQERDALMQTGQVDGELNELLTTALFNQKAPTIKSVAIARQAYPQAPLFRVLGAPQAAARTPTDLKGVPIGIAQNTVIEYVTDRLLRAAGVDPADIVYTEVSAIPARFELLMNGQLQAATLPDPLAQGAIAAGAHLIVDDAERGDISFSVLSFRIPTLQTKPTTVRKFLIAWSQAVQDLNNDPTAFQSLMIEKGRVPEAIQGTYQMPPFPLNQAPTAAQAADVVAWLREKGLIERDIPYEELVDASFLPAE